MSENNKKVELSEMLPIILEKLEAGGDVVIPVTGTSMRPLLKTGRDSVVLCSPPNKLNKNDIPLYRRSDGHFVLHRVVGEDKNGYILCGDNQTEKEYGIKHSQIIGVLKYIDRNGKRLPIDSFRFKLNQIFKNEIRFFRLGAIKVYLLVKGNR